MMLRLRTFFAAAWLMAIGGASPALADYAAARERFESLPARLQTSIGLALIATGDFEGLIEHGFTRRLYRAVRSFERREGLRADGVLAQDEIDHLAAVADRFYERLGTRYYTHATTGAKLLVPRLLFDEEKTTADGMLFSRGDGMLSLSFVSFPSDQRSFSELYATLSSSSAEKQVIYRRRFETHFVATGFFAGRKFYTWMARTGGSTTGFTLSWSEQWEETGRKLSTLLANSFMADPS
ncbi:hypothetical protein [Aestuariivirga sp.]|uniref:hypothetical protein n=1 Tax=Aestuariivirga sp. TaxID=2650926 RepID=UPI00391D1CAB